MSKEKTFNFLGIFAGGSIPHKNVQVGLRWAVDLSTFSTIFAATYAITPDAGGSSVMIEFCPPRYDKLKVSGNEEKELVNFLENYKASIKKDLLNDLTTSSFNEASNPKNLLIKKKTTDSLLIILQYSQQYFYIFFGIGFFVILVYSSLADLNRSRDLDSVNHKINVFNQPCSLNELQIYENRLNKRDPLVGDLDSKNSNFPYKIRYFFQKRNDSFYYFLKKIEWVLCGLKLYNLHLFYPTLFLKENFCADLYNKQKNQENHVSLEIITNDFILLRVFLILQLEKLARDCFLLGLSQVAFQILLFIICQNYFLNSFLSKLYIFWVLKNKNPFIACFFGFSLFLVNKLLFTILFVLLTKCNLFFSTKLVEMQQAARDFKKAKGECKDSGLNV